MITNSLPLIGIVTVLYNSDDVLPDFFSSLSLEADVNYKLYVIDNSQSDTGSLVARKLADKYSINAEIVFNNANYGVAKGNNQGISMAILDGCDYILLSNNDIQIKKGAISKLLLSLAGDGIDAATPKIYYYSSGNLIWYAGGSLDLWRVRNPHKGINEYDLGQYNQSSIVSYAPTCFMLLKAEVFEKIGLMDEQYFVYYDDTDFLLRMKRSNINLAYVPESIIEHKVSTSTGGDLSPFSIYYTTRNRIYFSRKNLSNFNKYLSIIYILATRFYFLLKIPTSLFGNVYRGIRDGFRLSIN